jgi:hypothetical protein
MWVELVVMLADQKEIQKEIQKEYWMDYMSANMWVD